MPYRTFEPVGISPAIVVTTGAEIPGQRVVALLGVVRGISVRRAVRGSEDLLATSTALRQAAETRLLDEARSLNADAVVGMRYDSNDAEVVAYGTAVRVERA
jgi:uncharacterized protein YbjQ (UPF0145 family)